MGAGKSTVGRYLADKLTLPHFDLDELVEQTASISIASFFATKGEGAFREAETKTLISIPQAGIVATGGGIVLSPTNYQIMKQSPSHIIWLHTPWRIIFPRIIHSDRPLVQAMSISQLEEEHARRSVLYNQWADWVVEADDSELACSKIIEWLR